MTFGEKILSLRKARKLNQRDLAALVGVSFTYISKIETGHLDFADYPSERLILSLAQALGTDPDGLMVLAGKVPGSVRARVIARPEVFLALAALDDDTLDRVLKYVARRR